MSRLAVLNQIRAAIGGQSAVGKLEDTRVFCIEDGEPIPEHSWRPEWYRHLDHVNQRAFLFDPTMKWEFRADGELRHYSAGAVLWRREENEDRYCLFRRRRYPIGYYTIPAGHMDMGEQPQEAALREAYEETQLGVVSVEPLGNRSDPQSMEIRDQCRRGSDYHVWNFYLCQCVGEPRLSEEGDMVGWFTRDEILGKLRLNRPTGICFGELFGEQPGHVREE